jgi:undecaprenyl-phosphate 4-deoxy-4-formamido-L-arabinose transferase
MAEAQTRVVPAPEGAPDAPELSLVVTLYDEATTVDELVRRATAVLDALGRPWEILVVDDGSTDGTWAAVERLHAADPRVRGVRFKRNFGQHPAMHAGLARARGGILVTMDGDLQNQPEDIPKLVEAVEAGYDVASGRRAARHDSWGRTLPSRMINGMLRRFTKVQITDFGCAFNAYRRPAVEAMLGAIGKQKFTKALILSGGATVVEVDVAHAPRAGRSRYSPFRLTRLALHVLAGFWPAADPVDRRRAGDGELPPRERPRRLRDRLLGRPLRLPGAAAARRVDPVRARDPGVHPGARRGEFGQNPARGRGPASLRDREGAVTQWRSACS